MLGQKDEKPKYEKIKPKHTFEDLELTEEVRTTIFEILEDRDYEADLKKEGLVPRKLLLLHGPPGCGKTSIAHALAAETDMPLFMANGAQVISAFVGEAEKNAEEIFRFAAEEECVMLVDEFDSFAQNRQGGARHEGRLVNSILVNMEQRPPKGITVMCTNFLESIDPAVRRRFDTILEIPPLSQEAMVKIAKGILKDRFDINPEVCVLEGKTPSGTVRAAKNRLRSAVIAANKHKKRPRKKAKKELPPEAYPPAGLVVGRYESFQIPQLGGPSPDDLERAQRAMAQQYKEKMCEEQAEIMRKIKRYEYWMP